MILKNIIPARLAEDQVQAIVDKRDAIVAKTTDNIVVALSDDLDRLLADRAGLLAELAAHQGFVRIVGIALNEAAALPPEMAAAHYQRLRLAHGVVTRPVAIPEGAQSANRNRDREPAI